MPLLLRAIDVRSSQLSDLFSLALFSAEDVRMQYTTAFIVIHRKAERGERMRLPDAPLRKAKKEVLADFPGILRMYKVQADDIAIFRIWEECSHGLGRAKADITIWESIV